MALADIRIGLTGAMDSLSEKLKGSLSLLKDVKEAGIEKMNQLVNDVLGLAPLIDHTGFHMKELSVDIGIPPGINISFSKENDIDPEAIDKLLEENKDTPGHGTGLRKKIFAWILLPAGFFAGKIIHPYASLLHSK